MNRTIASLLTGALLSAICLAQSPVAVQGGGSAAQDTSASPNKSGVKADSSTSAHASQDTTVSGKNAATAGQLQAGSTVQAELTKPVDARKCKLGDEVLARTTQDVKSNGQTVLPKGSKIIGHVTDVQAREKGQQQSHMAIAFDRAILKNGTQVPMPLTLQAIGSSPASASAAMDDSAMAGSMADDNVSGMATGAGATGSRAARGTLGGVASTSGRVVNTAGSTAGGTLNGVHSAGEGVAGGLTASSQGVIGLPGLTLSSASAVSSATSAGSVISSNNGNVHLDSGTRMILKANGQ
jgi:hypothetical protein